MKEYIKQLLPMEKDPTPIQSKNIIRLREDMTKKYYDAPDLQKVGNNAYRFINAVSDFATHSSPLRRTANYSEMTRVCWWFITEPCVDDKDAAGYMIL